MWMTHPSEMFMITGLAMIPWNVINMPVIEIPQISLEEQRKYAGRHAAIVEGRIVSSGDTAREAFQKAKELFPEKKTDEIGLLYIPREEMMIL